MSDIASFRVESPLLSMEPHGWTMLGLPTNFIAHAGTHLVDGTLFGESAEVRFTPTAYLWDYGDGTTRQTTTAGAPWSALQLPEFTETETSHAYSEAGSYLVKVTVHYAAAYRVSEGSWRTINGSVAAAAPELLLRVYRADTALVDEPCGAASTAAVGC